VFRIKKLFFTDPDPGIKNSEKMGLDPVLGLYLFQDPFFELKTKTTGKSGVVNFFPKFVELMYCPELQWS
jgi:hypothetical protein